MKPLVSWHLFRTAASLHSMIIFQHRHLFTTYKSLNDSVFPYVNFLLSRYMTFFYLVFIFDLCWLQGNIGHNALPYFNWERVVIPSKGVFLISSIAKYGSWTESLGFENKSFTVCTCLSATPLDSGYSRLLWRKLLNSVNTLMFLMCTVFHFHF